MCENYNSYKNDQNVTHRITLHGKKVCIYPYINTVLCCWYWFGHLLSNQEEILMLEWCSRWQCASKFFGNSLSKILFCPVVSTLPRTKQSVCVCVCACAWLFTDRVFILKLHMAPLKESCWCSATCWNYILQNFLELIYACGPTEQQPPPCMTSVNMSHVMAAWQHLHLTVCNQVPQHETGFPSEELGEKKNKNKIFSSFSHSQSGNLRLSLPRSLNQCCAVSHEGLSQLKCITILGWPSAGWLRMPPSITAH